MLYFRHYLKGYKMVSIPEFENSLINQAKANKQRIVLPEGDCERVLKAAAEALKQDIADIYNISVEDLELYFPILANYRNLCAQHHFVQS